MRVEGNSSDLAACSHVTSPKAREPLEIGRASEHITGKGWQSANIHRNPWVWAFASHVLLKAQWLSRQQLERFTRKGAANLWEEDEERLLTRALREAEAGGCVPPCTVLDIGAAYGYYSILARLVAPSLRVHAFNPHPIFVKNMRENLLLNHLEGSVCLHDAAVGATNGHAQLAYSVHGRIQNGTAARQRRMTRVRVVTLDTWARQWLHGQTPWLVKMDVEGEAGNALRHARSLLPHVRWWVIGIHNADEWKAVQAMLTEPEYERILSSRTAVGSSPNGAIIARRRGPISPYWAGNE
mmetsp:Transcript_22948/g.53013  ORF Transcript_22948/g.53013 Transcript_22948/m.53013 type:complete len:297 (-) Transcript_22948:305-1195(-)|eukprot:CAMPEP_0119403382 /NCGR_PEP_ID=MMETSP1334-20130426/143355_1 /TAXON_ID=127549 /ORGANISM="Calcidiscus leptoporus, Strain RCC1130" /LENGTH=296 /DNA_ID=CAMNT_0007427327 /DNA_START=113 /DNA_END=1003 /DNA_ORIENTATION=+